MRHDPIRWWPCAIGFRATQGGANLAPIDSETDMRRLLWLTAFIIASSLAAAQPPPRPPKPYLTVAVTRPKAFNEPGFAAFRTALATAAKSRVYARLAVLVRRQDFFWDRDFGQRFDRRKPAVDNLATAIALEHDHGAGWDKLSEFAAEAAVAPLDSRPGVVCAPARPSYDGVAYAKLLDATYTSAMDWAYPRADGTPVHDAPHVAATIIGALGSEFVWLLGFAGPDNEPDPGRKLWARIAMPDGRTGFVAPRSLMALTTERLCYSRDPVEGWQIAGFIAGGN
jgi:hypothetical protein